MCVVVVAKGFSEASFTTAFLYTTELFPTVLRYNSNFRLKMVLGLFKTGTFFLLSFMGI